MWVLDCIGRLAAEDTIAMEVDIDVHPVKRSDHCEGTRNQVKERVVSCQPSAAKNHTQNTSALQGMFPVDQ